MRSLTHHAHGMVWWVLKRSAMHVPCHAKSGPEVSVRGSAAGADARNSNYAYESGRIVKARAPAAIAIHGVVENCEALTMNI